MNMIFLQFFKDPEVVLSEELMNITMVPIPREYTYEHWVTGPSETGTMELTCLMPNGIIILLQANHNTTMAEIKMDLWEEATKLPLYGRLHDMSGYLFAYINSMAEQAKVYDESKMLCDIRPTAGILTISECKENEAEDSLSTKIGHLIGKSLQDFDSLNSPEINDFRFKMRRLAEELALTRSKKSWIDRLHYQYPPRLANDFYFFNDTKSENINITTKIDNPKISFTFNVSTEIRPKKLLEIIFNKKANILKTFNEKHEDFILKVCGRDEFLVGDHPLFKFQYIQDCISRNIIPTLLTISKDGVALVCNNFSEYSNFDIKMPKSMYSTLTLRKKNKHKSSWDIQDKFSIRLCTVSRINCDIKRNIELQIGIQVGLFHGGKSLCQPQKTGELPLKESCEIEFNETLEFDIEVCNIPRNVKLCFAVYEVNKYSKTNRSTRRTKEANNRYTYYNPIAWANTTVYDFKNHLRSGAMTLYMWTYAEDLMSDDVFHPLGTVVSNPYTKYTTALTLEFNSYAKDQVIQYPSPDILIEHAKQKFCNDYEEIYGGDINPETPKDTDLESLRKMILENDNLYEEHHQERKKLWFLKNHWCKEAPEVLPKLLYCIDWNNREEVSEIVAMLRKWPRLPVERALELLDYAYPDQEVRRYAVKCLVDVSDEDLLLYLLQLVQAIKHELYLECDLVTFLLERALNNQKIGHYLFWHLRSEMQVPAVSVRFGLILEAYCWGSREHIPILNRQLDCLEKLKQCSEVVRARRDKDKARACLKQYLRQLLPSEAMHDVRSPLDPTYRCSRVRIDECRVMDSKMRPIWIVFENSDPYGDDIHIIFKNGDDLRQDMLTLQMLKIMDRLWKREGLDLRMIPYNCISMENCVGMIEVVLNAETIANIQKEKGIFSATSAFRKASILAWLKDHNTTEASLKKAINEFTLSCAGYCVATYILGVADRHSDNIMIRKSGQLFHIDFGRILGHFKEKFGIKRERVPFVLTHDFVHVINKGQKNTLEFKIFQEYCEKAFMILRKHGNLLISLCAMMISTGLPELSSEKDLNYLKETLVLSKTDEEALNHFRSKFIEALRNSWKTSLNWTSHNLAKNNKP